MYYFVNALYTQTLSTIIENLPLNQTPSWLDSPNNIENVLLTRKGTSISSNYLNSSN